MSASLPDVGTVPIARVREVYAQGLTGPREPIHARALEASTLLCARSGGSRQEQVASDCQCMRVRVVASCRRDRKRDYIVSRLLLSR